MWEMFDDMIECNECGGVLGPPPKFTIPPPPRPPYLGEYSLGKCNEEEMALKAQQAWEGDICEAMPILDASLYSSQSLQTSAIIAVFTLLLVLVILISSLFVWKNKRKVQNFLPCKTPTRGPHINGALPLGGHHALTYEDPDVHLGHHRPLVMRHHHNVEMLHGKSIHYPSGYPMTRSPPFLVSSSPGPDPYRSNDNVYEELGPGRDSDGESEPPLHSDDDFAEDELSLPGERFFNKQNEVPVSVQSPNVPTIYHERTPVVCNVGASSSNAIGQERNSVLSTSSTSTQEASTATLTSIRFSQNNNQNIDNASYSGPTASRCSSSNIFPGILRHTTGRNKFHNASAKSRCRNGDRRNASVDDFNTSSSTTDANEIGPLQQMYDNRSNLMSLAYISQHHQHQHQASNGNTPPYHSLHQQKNNKNNSGHCNVRSTSVQFYNTLENEVERRNRMNVQLNNVPPVATIYRERINFNGGGRFNLPQPYYVSNSNNGLLANSMRARTISRSMDRRHRVATPIHPVEPSYGYAEPVYQSNYHYDTCGSPATLDARLVQLPVSAYSSSQLTSDYTTGGTYQDHASHNAQHIASAPMCPGSAQLYSRGDSSFGSDSGYSHHTPASSIGRHDYDMTVPMPIPNAPTRTGNKESTTSKISAALSFGWHRRKSTPTHNAPTSLKVQSATQNHLYNNATEATSPNNNSASSTITSTLENTSSASSASASGCSTASSQNNNTIAAQAQSQA